MKAAPARRDPAGRPALTGLVGSATLLAALSSLPLAAQIPTPVVSAPDTGAATAPTPADTLTGEERTSAAALETWLDGWMAARLDAENVAGATVSIVRDGEVLLAKGYGWADRDERTHVDAEGTLFRIGSISKLFVWTSVMQLVEQGLVSLDEDVNVYLKDVQVPDAWDRPVTLADLMTHSAGFEDHVIGLFGEDSTDLRPANELLREQMPERIRPPGDVTAYSNHGTALAMQVVEDVSGQPWLEYIEEHVLQPLGMGSTTFRQPLPSTLVERMSEGYASGGTRAQPFEYVPLGAVGAAASSATDMARFMIAHLHLGTLDGRRILQDRTARLMQSELFRNAPGANPFLHGFADLSRRATHIIGHGGDTFWFHSQLALLPEHDLGLFVSFNTAGGNPAALVTDFVEHYFDLGEPTAPATAPDVGDLDRFTGRFRSNRMSHSDFTKLSGLVGTFRVENRGDTALGVTLGSERTWVPVGPTTFEGVDSGRKLVFRENDAGRITHAFLADTPYLGFERIPWSENPGVHLPLGIAALVIFLLAAVGLPVPWFFRRRYQHQPESVIPGVGRLLAWCASLGFLVFVVGLAVSMGDANQIAMGDIGGLRWLGLLPLIAGVLGATALLVAVLSWFTGRGTRPARLAFTVLTLAFVTFTWQLEVWNLLRWTP